MSRGHFWPLMSRDTNVEVSALSPVTDKVEVTLIIGAIITIMVLAIIMLFYFFVVGVAQM